MWLALALVLVLAGCATSLGRLRSSDVQDAIQNAQSAIDDAQRPNLSQAAAASLALANSDLSEARRALVTRQGVKALQAAQRSQAHAEQAIVLDRQQTLWTAKLAAETALLEAQLAEARAREQSTREAAQKIRDDLASVRLDVADIRADAVRNEKYKLDAESRALASEANLQSAEERIRELTEALEATTALRAEAEAQLAQFSSQFETAQKALATARAEATQQGRRAVTVEQEAKGMAAAYTSQIDQLERERKQDAALTRARQAARQRTQPTSLSEEDLRSATPAVQSWKAAWEKGDLDAHRGFYATSTTTSRVDVRKGTESRTTVSADALSSLVRSIRSREWIALPRSSVHAEGDGVVAELAFRRSSDAPASAQASDFCVRRAYWRRIGGTWRITREEWRFYDDVPEFRAGG